MSLAASSRSPFGAILDAAPRADRADRVDRAFKEARRTDSMESKSDSGRVNRRASARDRVQPLVAAMVEDQEQQSGSRMRAYDIVGRWIGVKRTWVRRLVGRQDVGLTGDRLLAIAAAYREHCVRLEARAAENRAATARRWEETDAILEGLGGPGPELGAEPAEPGRLGPGAPKRREPRP